MSRIIYVSQSSAVQHYKVELKDNSVELTEEGIALAEMALETNDLWDENDPWAR